MLVQFGDKPHPISHASSHSGPDGSNAAVTGSKVCFVRSNTADGSWVTVVGFDVAGRLLATPAILTEEACRQACLSTGDCSYYAYDSTASSCKAMQLPLSDSSSGTTGSSSTVRVGFRTASPTICSYTCSESRSKPR